MELPITTEDRIKALERRAAVAEAAIRQLEETREVSTQQIRLLHLGRSDDVTSGLIALNVLAFVSIVEAVAIVLLWWTR